MDGYMDGWMAVVRQRTINCVGGMQLVGTDIEAILDTGKVAAGRYCTRFSISYKVKVSNRVTITICSPAAATAKEHLGILHRRTKIIGVIIFENRGREKDILTFEVPL